MTVWLLNGLGAFCCNWGFIGQADQLIRRDGGIRVRPFGDVPQENRAVKISTSEYAAILTKRNAPDLRRMAFERLLELSGGYIPTDGRCGPNFHWRVCYHPG